MTTPHCHSCKYHRVVRAWQKLESGEWDEFDRNICLHKNADLDGKYKRGKHGGVPVGQVCWTCRGEWR